MNPAILCGGISFERASVEMRETVAFRKEQFPDALARLRRELGLQEAVLISTCNRVEYFAAASSPAVTAQAWPLFLKKFHGASQDLGDYCFQIEGGACVEHLFAMAAGLKSMVVGETEILGQLKEFYAVAHHQGATGKWLNRLFQSSFAAAKAVRACTPISRGNVSVASVAVSLAEKIFGDLEACKGLVIGAGDTGEKTARALVSRGMKQLCIIHRTADRAEALARSLQVQALPCESLEEACVEADIVISSTSAPYPILTRETLERLMPLRRNPSLFLIDLAVPRDFDPEIDNLEEVYLYNLDDLQSIALRNLQERHAALARSLEILQPHVQRYCSWIAAQNASAFVAPAS